MKSGRWRTMAHAVIAGTVLSTPLTLGNPATKTPGLSLYEFVATGTGPLPWNAVSFEGSINNTTMLGGPHAISANGATLLAYRTSNNDVAIALANANGTTQWNDLTTQAALPLPGADPQPFFSPSGSPGVLYVSTNGHLIMVTNADVHAARAHNVDVNLAFQVTDLTTRTGVTAAAGLASITTSTSGSFITVRTTSNNIAVLPLSWPLASPSTPIVTGPSVNISTTTSTGTVTSDPVVVPGPVPSLVAVSSSGDLNLFTSATNASGSWSVQDLTTLTAGARVVGPLQSAANATTIYVAGLSATGNVNLFSTPLTSFVTTALSAHATPLPPASWKALNVTGVATGAPPLAGSVSLNVSDAQVVIAGQAANWGDLFALTNATLTPTIWSATDVSVTGGNAARTVGSVVTGYYSGGSLQLFAAGISSPPPQGVGVYAIPSAKWGKAIADGWPIISETGALGTKATPWVGFTSTSSVAASPDYLMGQAIYKAHKRVTWLSFWTVSGPVGAEKFTAATFYNHGLVSGTWVATQIAQYRALGVGLKPDWVIFDPEGYPDNHSGLDAPAGSSKASISAHATYWSSFLKGWAAGIAAVDPSLHAGFYATQSEYRAYALSTSPLPVFMAVAFGGGGPIPIGGETGANIRGYIAFSAVCNPTATLKSQEATLLNPPWSGQFNTLQFNAGVYCPPA